MNKTIDNIKEIATNIKKKLFKVEIMKKIIIMMIKM